MCETVILEDAGLRCNDHFGDKEMDHPELWAIPLGLAGGAVIALTPYRLGLLLATIATEAAMLCLWLLAAPNDQCTTDMCERALVVWDAYRLLLVGGPALLVAMIVMLKLWFVQREDDRRREAEEFWTKVDRSTGPATRPTSGVQ